MSTNQLVDAGVPDWYVKTLRTVDNIDQGLRELEDEVSEVMCTEAMDERVRMQMGNLRDALRDINCSLILLDMMARDVLDQTSIEAA